MSKKKREKFIDDGRTIANMNVEGMAWYNPAKTESKDSASSTKDSIQLSKKEKAAMMRGVLAAALLVALIFVAVFTLFILFCIFVWFA